nr:uncharacterized protein LOC129155510 [Nothobranchius furzeri]
MRMTRGKKTEQLWEEPDDGEPNPEQLGAAAPATAAREPDKLEDLSNLVKTLIRPQSSSDQLLEKESTHQEQRWKDVQHQFGQIQAQVRELKGELKNKTEWQEEEDDDDDDDDVNDDHDGGPPAPTRNQPLDPPPRAPLLHKQPKLLYDEDDIEHYLTTFERIATVCCWPKEEWAIQLIPLLTGKTHSAYVLMDLVDFEDYDKVKEVILAKYEITADTYCRRFRALDIKPVETPKELYVRLKDLFNRWVKPDTSSVKELSEMLILEQFLQRVNPEMEVWIKERAPKSAEEAASFAELFLSARTGSRRPAFSWDLHFSSHSKSSGGERDGQTQTQTYSSPRQFFPKPSKKSLSGSRGSLLSV